MLKTIILMCSVATLSPNEVPHSHHLRYPLLASREVGTLSAAPLLQERARLEKLRPSLAVGVALTTLGSGLTVTSVVLGALVVKNLFFTLTDFFPVSILVMGVGGIVAFAVGLPLMIVGIVNLAHAAAARRDLNERIESIDRKLDEIEMFSTRKIVSTPRMTLARF